MILVIVGKEMTISDGLDHALVDVEIDVIEVLIVVVVSSGTRTTNSNIKTSTTPQNAKAIQAKMIGQILRRSHRLYRSLRSIRFPVKTSSACINSSARKIQL